LLVSLVEGLHPTPAYLLGPLTRILAWNPAASALFGSPDHLSPERRSLLWMLLVDPGDARYNPGREGTARNMVARFRSEYAQHAGEPAYEQFIAELRERSPWFVAWWGEHEVNDTQRGTKTIEHPTLGTLRLHHAQTVPTGAPDLRLTIYAPADAATRVALAKLPSP
jgi:PAS domain-containing protein